MQAYQAAVMASLGFFWKAGWAFVLGYFISASIQAFVPKGGLTKVMGSADFKSISLSTLFGTLSSSCSFAALSAARSLIGKGAHFIAGVAFMFASTNLVIELGIMIFIFLGWQYLAAEIIGGLILIAISSMLIRLTYPRRWLDQAREHVREDVAEDDDSFDWRSRIRSLEGWQLVGHKFVMEWKMVWQEILIGFVIAGIISSFVPREFWETIFLRNAADSIPEYVVVIENALVGPLVAACTFIGSMGNIPLATVLNANGVLFAGIMGFIYSDLIVPPLVAVNAKYYGMRVALYIAGIMFVSIVSTALILHYSFAALGLTPESERVVEEVTRFRIDYTFWLNLLSLFLVTALVWGHRKHLARMTMDGQKMKWNLKNSITALAALYLLVGSILRLVAWAT